MLNDPLYKQLLEQSWQRKLTETEESRLRGLLESHPEAQTHWDIEAALSEALGQLPPAPVSSNFTALVLQRLERESQTRSRRRGKEWQFWRKLSWFPTTALAALVLGVGLLTYTETRIVHRQALLKSVEAVSRVASLPSPRILEDYNAIQALSTAPAADEQLLALLQ